MTDHWINIQISMFILLDLQSNRNEMARQRSDKKSNQVTTTCNTLKYTSAVFQWQRWKRAKNCKSHFLGQCTVECTTKNTRRTINLIIDFCEVKVKCGAFFRRRHRSRIRSFLIFSYSFSQSICLSFLFSFTLSPLCERAYKI